MEHVSLPVGITYILYIPLEEDRLVSVFRREQNKDLLLHYAALSHERTWNWKEK